MSPTVRPHKGKYPFNWSFKTVVRNVNKMIINGGVNKLPVQKKSINGGLNKLQRDSMGDTGSGNLEGGPQYNNDISPVDQ